MEQFEVRAERRGLLVDSVLSDQEHLEQAYHDMCVKHENVRVSILDRQSGWIIAEVSR